MELKKLLYAVDLEDAPHPAIEHVKMVASLTGASVSIVYVLPSETVYESNYLSGEGQPNRIAPTQALLEKMEHFLNTNSRKASTTVRSSWGRFRKKSSNTPTRATSTASSSARMAGSGSGNCSPGPWPRKS